MYQAVWRCRLCGQRFIGAVELTNNETDNYILRMALESKPMVSVHNCYGNSKGLADFLGYEHYGDKDVE